MTQTQLEGIVNPEVLNRTVQRFREKRILLPTFEELAHPNNIPEDIHDALHGVDPNQANPLNLFRINWYNDGQGSISNLPHYLELPRELTGVDAKIVILIGAHFPMIGAHKVLAAYGCLVPRLVSGEFDPENHKAVWPSTGNYCRGGVAVSRIMDSRGVAVLPEGMSRERFDWLEHWVTNPEDIIKTPGTESNVKEIYDKVNRLRQDPRNFIFNQFAEFGNYLAHYSVTGPAVEIVAQDLAIKYQDRQLRTRAFVSATGSAGTIAAGDYLKELYLKDRFQIVAVEAAECPTLLNCGYGSHNIQGIGDKHVPLIHNVMNTDIVTAISDANTDAIFTLFNTPEGRDYLVNSKGVPAETVEALRLLGISSIANILGAIKVAKHRNYGKDDVIYTVATDSAAMYTSEIEKAVQKHFGGQLTSLKAAEAFGRYMLGLATDNYLELTHDSRNRIFNLGYYTWVEQQGVSQADFDARRSEEFWERQQHKVVPLDVMIRNFNQRVNS